MKRLYISITLMALMAALGLYNMFTVKSSVDSLLTRADEIRLAVESGGDTLALCEEFAVSWQSLEDELTLIDCAGCFNDLAAEIGKLPAYARSGSEELLPELDLICRRLEGLYARQCPALANLL